MSFDPATSFGKMWPDLELPTIDGISLASFEVWPTLVISEPSGLWTHDGSECPNGVVAISVCSLASVLEPNGEVPAKYWLSPTACAGILRRAAKRGKTLPAPLAAALTAVAGVTTPTGQRSSPSKPVSSRGKKGAVTTAEPTRSSRRSPARSKPAPAITDIAAHAETEPTTSSPPLLQPCEADKPRRASRHRGAAGKTTRT